MVGSKRKQQKQIWADTEFIGWLKKLKAKKELDGEEIGESEFLDSFLFSDKEGNQYDWGQRSEKFVPRKK